MNAVPEKLTGFEVAPLDFTTGSDIVEQCVDLPPCRAEPHLRLKMEAFQATSFGLIVRKPPG